MTYHPFETGAAERVTAKLMAAKAGLGQPHEGRWRWWRKRRRMVHLSRMLMRTPPASVTRYDTATQSVKGISRNLLQTRRRHIAWLWVRIVIAGIVAVIRRGRTVIMIIAVTGGLGAAGYFGGPPLIQFLGTLLPAPPASQTSPTSPTIPAPVTTTSPQSPLPQSPPVNGTTSAPTGAN